MNIAIHKMLETSKTSMQIFTEEKLVPYKMNFKGMSSISKDYLDYWIINSVVKRALEKTINVINEILKIYGTPEIIEMTRDKNSAEEIKKIKFTQRKNEGKNKEIEKILKENKLD